jgi:hypothetical protein
LNYSAEGGESGICKHECPIELKDRITRRLRAELLSLLRPAVGAKLKSRSYVVPKSLMNRAL